jgi:hypothetical protein
MYMGDLGENPDQMAGLGGDLLVIEGLDQSEEPREVDYLPEYVNWTWKPFADGYGAYRQGPNYWGVGVQKIPGFEPPFIEQAVDGTGMPIPPPGPPDKKVMNFNRRAESRYTVLNGMEEFVTPMGNIVRM